MRSKSSNNLLNNYGRNLFCPKVPTPQELHKDQFFRGTPTHINTSSFRSNLLNIKPILVLCKINYIRLEYKDSVLYTL